MSELSDMSELSSICVKQQPKVIAFISLYPKPFTKLNESLFKMITKLSHDYFLEA